MVKIVQKKQRRRILHLTLKKKWFYEIVSLKKMVEYREIKPYWTRRFKSAFFGKNKLIFKEFDEVHFTNGYGKDKPFMRVRWEGIGYGEFEGKRCYAIKLGTILEYRKVQQ